MMDDDEEPMVVAANLVSFLERLDDELYLSLRIFDNHSAEVGFISSHAVGFIS